MQKPSALSLRCIISRLIIDIDYCAAGNRGLISIALIDFWAGFLVGDGEPLRALDISSGVDAVFQLAPRTGFSKRANA